MKSVLVVEDEVCLRDAIISYLALEGVAADGAATLKEARELMFKGNYTVVVLDLNLPDGDGVEFAKELPETTGVIIVSARGALHQRLEGLRTGADAYLVKPIDLPELFVIVTNIRERLDEASEKKDGRLLKEATVTWLGEYAAASTCYIESSDAEILDIPRGASGGSGTIQILPIGSDISVCSIAYSPGPGAVDPYHHIASIRMTLSEPALVLAAMDAGKAMISEKVNGADIELEQGIMLFELTQEPIFPFALDAQAVSKVRMLCISRTLLYNILELDYIESLKQQLQVSRETGATLVPVSKMVETLFQSCVPDNLESDKQQLLGLHSRILTFLNSLAENLEHGNPAAKQEGLAEKLQQLYEELLQPAAENMTLHDMADRFNCSAKTLNDGFKKLYGQSIVSFQFNQRMLAAHEELLATRTPIKTIAFKYGYSHVNHFTTAFRKHFGYTPGSLRK